MVVSFSGENPLRRFAALCVLAVQAFATIDRKGRQERKVHAQADSFPNCRFASSQLRPARQPQLVSNKQPFATAPVYRRLPYTGSIDRPGYIHPVPGRDSNGPNSWIVLFFESPAI